MQNDSSQAIRPAATQSADRQAVLAALLERAVEINDLASDPDHMNDHNCTCDLDALDLVREIAAFCS
ncbi:hypothetical protein P3T27_007551 [Kitasatospora sp. MAA19]|uniref:hypothetical protein n=1 Tax=unclassified Kitasatospora TaxID=2633591 RepID=UPI0024738B73|nr:hypothetical protein [Kitasatospora sp. MAA19]MDH6710800.1 hypothetical protein [Kitasatospora sp. MAA19]